MGKAKQQASLSIFATNIHMAAHTLLINGIMLVLWNGGTIRLQLPSHAVVPALINEALNGIVISLLQRRMDSIAKNYAFSVSVFVTAGLSAAVLGYRPSLQFFCGAGLTVLS